MTSLGSDFFVGNRKKLRDFLRPNGGIAVITASAYLEQSVGEPFPFFQDRYFWFLTGLNLPGAVLVINQGEDYIILPKRSKVQDIFDGSFDRQMMTKSSGIETFIDYNDGWDKLESEAKDAKLVGFLEPNDEYIEADGIYTNPSRRAIKNRLLSMVRHLSFMDLRPQLSMMRMIKSDAEVAVIREAIRVTGEALKEVLTQKYEYEYELEAAITYGIRKRGADGNAFAPIVAGGKNACTLHYSENNSKLPIDGLVVLDVGARLNNYSADITRTIAIGTPTKRQLDVYNAVKDIQSYAFRLIKPGASFKDYAQEVRFYMAKKLQQLNLSSDAKKYCPHGVSHFLGLDTHDVGDYNQPMTPGMVFTVEPGIYIPEEGIGIRIEDDILVTESGCEVLSANIEKM